MATTYGTTTPMMSSTMPNPTGIGMTPMMLQSQQMGSDPNMSLPLSYEPMIRVTEDTPNLEEIQSFPVLKSNETMHLHQDPITGQRYGMANELHARIPEILARRRGTQTGGGMNMGTTTMTTQTSVPTSAGGAIISVPVVTIPTVVTTTMPINTIQNIDTSENYYGGEKLNLELLPVSSPQTSFFTDSISNLDKSTTSEIYLNYVNSLSESEKSKITDQYTLSNLNLTNQYNVVYSTEETKSVFYYKNPINSFNNQQVSSTYGDLVTIKYNPINQFSNLMFNKILIDYGYRYFIPINRFINA